MKLLIYITLLLLLSYPVASAQTTTGQFNTARDSTYKISYNKLKNLFIEHMMSPCYQNRRAMSINYKEKLNSKGAFDTKYVVGDTGALNWLKNNWEKTAFKSFTEAEQEHNAIMEAISKCDEQHPEFIEYYLEAVTKYGPSIYTDMFIEVVKEYPDKW